MVVRFGPRAGMCGAVLKEVKMANTNSKPGASDADGHEPDRRDFIVVATYAMGAVGAGAVGDAAVLLPFGLESVFGVEALAGISETISGFLGGAEGML